MENVREHNIKIDTRPYCPAAIIKNKQTLENGICIREDHGYIPTENHKDSKVSVTTNLFCLPATMTD